MCEQICGQQRFQLVGRAVHVHCLLVWWMNATTKWKKESYLHKIPFTPTELSLEREAMKSIFLKLMRKKFCDLSFYLILLLNEKNKWENLIIMFYYKESYLLSERMKQPFREFFQCFLEFNEKNNLCKKKQQKPRKRI